MNDFVNIQNARPGGYDKVIADIAEKRVCPFCPEQLVNFHKNPVEQKKYWILTDNMYPYKPTKVHKLIVHIEHIEHITEISSEAWQELQEIIKEVHEKDSLAGGTFVMRFGETRFTGASVTHLHANLVQSNPDDSSYDPQRGLLVRVG
jgi:ATP adenylyltransferase